jgi:hypothetical protein
MLVEMRGVFLEEKLRQPSSVHGDDSNGAKLFTNTLSNYQKKEKGSLYELAIGEKDSVRSIDSVRSATNPLNGNAAAMPRQIKTRLCSLVP